MEKNLKLLPDKIYAWNYVGCFNTGIGLPVVDMGDTPWAEYIRADLATYNPNIHALVPRGSCIEAMEDAFRSVYGIPISAAFRQHDNTVIANAFIQGWKNAMLCAAQKGNDRDRACVVCMGF